jgi:tRNA pseudouridine55 synthase
MVDRVVRALGRRRVGHAGTLDPFAEGLLLVPWGTATVLVPFLHFYPKTYLCELEFGLVTDTQDRTGQVLERRDASGLGEEEVRRVLEGFRGTIRQRPPMHSALKHRGRRLHEIAREGGEVPRREREREIHRLELVRWDPPRAAIEVCCSSGTYVRTLVHDLGERLGPGACATRLVRTRIGPHRLEDAVPGEAVEGMSPEEIRDRSLTLADALPDWPAVKLADEGEIRRLRNGAWPDPRGEAREPGRYRVTDASGRLLALVEGGTPPRILRVMAGEESPCAPR